METEQLLITTSQQEEAKDRTVPEYELALARNAARLRMWQPRSSTSRRDSTKTR
jgi:hypothetical protein